MISPDKSSQQCYIGISLLICFFIECLDHLSFSFPPGGNLSKMTVYRFDLHRQCLIHLKLGYNGPYETGQFPGHSHHRYLGTFSHFN